MKFGPRFAAAKTGAEACQFLWKSVGGSLGVVVELMNPWRLARKIRSSNTGVHHNNLVTMGKSTLKIDR